MFLFILTDSSTADRTLSSITSHLVNGLNNIINKSAGI